MSGLWDRLVGNVEDDGVPTHRITGVILFAGEDEFTNPQLLTWVNTGLTTPIDANAQTDILDMKAVYQAKLNDGEKGLYLHIIESMCSAVEDGQPVTEGTWRAKLEI